MTTFICLYAPANSGKSRSIRRVDEILQSYGAKVISTLFDEYDFAREYTFRNKKIGILSLGDPDSAQDDWLAKIVNDDCDIIVCASRTKGATCDIVSSKLKQGDSLYWISPLYEYESSLPSPLQADMQEYNAQFIIKYILSIK